MVLSCFSSDMVCLQSCFFFFLFCSFLVNFTNLSWKEFNIILIIYWVECTTTCVFCCCFFLFLFFFSYSCFLFCFCLVPGVGVGGALAFMKKTGVWGSILLTIYVLVYYILFFHFLQLWLLSLNVMCCGLQLVLWFHLLALLNLGFTSRLQGFIWRSADKVPAWKSSSFSFPATDDIPWVPADQLAKLSHYRLVSNAAGFLAE